jgi:hypothetical protein
MAPEGEALQVSRAIFLEFQRQAAADGATFVLAVLPFEPHWWDGSARLAARKSWQGMISFVCSKPLVCIDLLPEFVDLTPAEVDRAAAGDEWHFGPAMNLRIATTIRRRLESAAILPLGGHPNPATEGRLKTGH